MENKIKMSGVVMTFHKDSCKRAYCDCSEDKGILIKEKYFQINRKIEGEKISYNSNGNVSSKCFYIDGKLEGEKIRYHENGNLHTKCFYKNGEMDGEFVFYLSNENIDKIYFYQNGHYIKKVHIKQYHS